LRRLAERRGQAFDEVVISSGKYNIFNMLRQELLALAAGGQAWA